MKVATAFLALMLTAVTATGAPEAESVRRPHAWPDEILDLASRLPVQDGGRIKPLSTVARFTLLAASGRTTARTSRGEDAESLSATAFLLDCLFFPEAARHYPIFLVADSEVLRDLGLGEVARKKRDRYSFAEIIPAREAMIEKARAYHRIEPRNRTNVQGQVVDLVDGITRIETLLMFLDYADDPRSVRWSVALAILPPSAPRAEAPEWLTPAEAIRVAAREEGALTAQIALLDVLGEMKTHRSNREEFAARMVRFHDEVVGLAEARGEYSKVPLEVLYYRVGFLTYALIAFLVGFVLLAIGWMRPEGVWLTRGAAAILTVGLVLLTTAIVLRCVIRSRPPVSTLYETILFVTGTTVLTSLAIEWMNRQRIAIVFAAALGAAGLFLAQRYELKEAADTMPSLVAVLDTNFWLATHVTTVTLGYAAGLLACAIAHVTVVGRVLGLGRRRRKLYASLTRMTYGVIAFGLFFSLLGTILGGIWANESWGRFWGWDPKENGALLIVLAELAILHGRMGGYLKEMGLAISSVLLGIVVAFSWWGVNLLGVGLHSYGFTSGIARLLHGYYALEGLVAAAGIAHVIVTRVRRSGPGPAEPPEGLPVPR